MDYTYNLNKQVGAPLLIKKKSVHGHLIIIEKKNGNIETVDWDGWKEKFIPHFEVKGTTIDLNEPHILKESTQEIRKFSNIVTINLFYYEKM